MKHKTVTAYQVIKICTKLGSTFINPVVLCVLFVDT